MRLAGVSHRSPRGRHRVDWPPGLTSLRAALAAGADIGRRLHAVGPIVNELSAWPAGPGDAPAQMPRRSRCLRCADDRAYAAGESVIACTLVMRRPRIESGKRSSMARS